MSPTRHPYFAGMLGCGILLGLLALQATPAAGSSFNIYVVNADAVSYTHLTLPTN